MTSDPMLPGDGHLDDEALSAVLDGEGTVAESAHAESCPTCSARLASLRDASVLVATPVPPSDGDRRDASIAAALAAFGTEEPGAAPTNVVPLFRRLPTQWLAAAAALVLVIGAFAFLGSAGDDDDVATGASDDSAAESAGGGDSAAADQDLSTMMAVAPYDAGDVGTIDVTALHDDIALALSGAGRETTQDDAAADAPNPAASSFAGTQVPCESEVRTSNDRLGPLAYRATGTLNDEPVVVLAFSLDADTWVYVLSAEGCEIRNQQTFST